MSIQNVGNEINLLIFFQCSSRDDEGSVRKLRGPKDDWRGRADAAQGADAQDPAPYRVIAQVHVRQTHHREAGEVFHEGAGAGPHRPPAA